MTSPGRQADRPEGARRPAMRAQPRWFVGALGPIATGVLWLALGWRASLVFGVLASVPGGVLLATGVLLLWPGDRQITHYMALSSLLSLPLALIAPFFIGLWSAAALLLLGVLVFHLAGYTALRQEPLTPDAPPPDLTARMARKVGVDESLLAYFVGTARVPTEDEVESDAAAMRLARDRLAAHGWLTAPAGFHRDPSSPDSVDIKPLQAAGQRFERVRYASEYEPPASLPGFDRWMSYEDNRDARAWIFRHEGGPRPWLVGIHGYRMGIPAIDLTLFRVGYLHHALGLNVALPVLPLHGPRKAYTRSGSGFLDGRLVDLLHAEAQAIWDIRRLIAWLRSEHRAPAVGALGYSLGGYNAALLSTLEPDLACVIAGIPLVDMVDSIWRHMPMLQLRLMEAYGIERELAETVLKPVSPLAMDCRVAPERRYVFAATGDQLVPPSHPVRLIRHWGTQKTHWYQGAHLSVRREQSVRPFIGTALVESGLAAPDRETAHGLA